MTIPDVQLDQLGVRFGAVDAVTDVTVGIPAGSICGVLGRNGAGKTTLLSTLAAFRRPTSGSVRVGGVDPYENAAVMSDTMFVGATDNFPGCDTIGEVIGLARDLRPRWDDDYATDLRARFDLPTRGSLDSLSLGKRSALAIVEGLASRAPLTIFDEPHLGLDAPTRYAFYDELLADYMRRPRTILLSSHLIDEVASLLEWVMILDQGRMTSFRRADELRSEGCSITGPTDAVRAFTAPLRILESRTLGRTTSVSVLADAGSLDRGRLDALGLDVAPISLQDLFVHLTRAEASS